MLSSLYLSPPPRLREITEKNDDKSDIKMQVSSCDIIPVITDEYFVGMYKTCREVSSKAWNLLLVMLHYIIFSVLLEVVSLQEQFHVSLDLCMRKD